MPASKSETAPKVAGSPGPTSNSRLRMERENSNDPASPIPHPAATRTTVAIRNALPGGHSHQLGDTFSVDSAPKGMPHEVVSKLLGTRRSRRPKHYSPWVKSRSVKLEEAMKMTWL